MLVRHFAALLPVVPASGSDLAEAMELSAAGGMQFFDALLVSTAARAGCEVLLTKDMQHGRQVRTLQLLNPFMMAPSELDKLFS